MPFGLLKYGFSRRYPARPDFPKTPEGRLALLTRALHVRPNHPRFTSVHFRDLDSLPDEDVISLLRQLAELGVLDELL